jgi:acyl transferase domain-containing protein/SAM-dependent methyltransferase
MDWWKEMKMGEMQKNRDHDDRLNRALIALKKMRFKLDQIKTSKSSPIAVIGTACRFPGGAEDTVAFWRLLREGFDAIRTIPESRWDIDAYYDPDPDAPGKMSTKWGGFLEHMDYFDAEFFGISPREAMSMDPQQRLLLEVSWEALEHAGQVSTKLIGSRTGVFVGMDGNDYLQLLMKSDPNRLEAYFASGGSASAASGRLSYVFGLQGPSMTINTACSSSLAAVHLACQSLRDGECSMALAGGVNIISMPSTMIVLSKAGMLAADGRCKTFDATADGFGRGEGCGMIVLKQLTDAVKDGDNILAVIRGSAVNQDGRGNGFSAPNGLAQEEVLNAALSNAGVKAVDVQYVEAHGTGTSLGDPIEINALASIYCRDRSSDDPLFIGSVKTNIGHLEAASGIASLIKVVLCLLNEEIPPHLHLGKLNPYISWSDMPIRVVDNGILWPKGVKKRIAGVSAFGFSGTNAHVIVEEAPMPVTQVSGENRPLHLLTISAKSEKALKEQEKRLAHHLDVNRELAVGDLAYSLNLGRSHFSHRIALVSETTDEALHKLVELTEGNYPEGVFVGEVPVMNRPEVVFLFTGQGAEYPGMGQRLFKTQPVFREAIEHCSEILRQYWDRNLSSVLYPENGESPLLELTLYAQPALFAVEYALAELLRSWGIKPEAVIGHSVGEYVAACVAGVFSLEDGLRLITKRARLIHSLPAEGMMAEVFASEESVRSALAFLPEGVSISCLNSPENTVISGEGQLLRDVLLQFENAGVRFRLLKEPQAFHSHMLEPILEEFEATAREVSFDVPRVPLISNLTGEITNRDYILGADYWRRHMREPVRFMAGIHTLYERGYQLFLELGPDPVLSGIGRQILPAGNTSWFPSLKRNHDDWQQMLETLGQLYVRGVEIDWEGFNSCYNGRKVVLPTYAFQRERFWLEPSVSEVIKSQSEEDPSYIWKEAITAGRRQVSQIPIDLNLHTYSTKWEYLDRLTTSHIIHSLRQFGAFTNPEETHAIDSFMSKMQIVPIYRGLLARWMERLANEGYLNRQGEMYVSTEPLPDPNMSKVKQEAEVILADVPFLLEYIERCSQKIIAVLTGKENPLETLFPGGSYETAEGIYQEWPVQRYFNQIIAAVVQSIMGCSPNGKTFRIIEVGAGTGGTTSFILPVLPRHRTSYFFTDTSEFFFNHAEEKFKTYPFVNYAPLDIEKSPEEQGFDSQKFDFVIAANVLHATRNLRNALQNVLFLLKPNGLLLLYEVTAPHSWFDITAGLIEGWQLHNDDLRQDNPLLSKQQWVDLIRSQGFQDAVAFPEEGSAAEVLKAHVLVARAPNSFTPLRSSAPPNSFMFETTDVKPIRREKVEEEGKVQADESLVELLKQASQHERHELLVDHVRGVVMQVLRRDAYKPLNRHHRLMDVGVDSLMAIELRNRLRTGLGLKEALSATLVFDYPTIDDIADFIEQYVLEENKLLETTSNTTDEHGDRMEAFAREIEDITEEEAQKMILEKLDSIEEDE